MENNNMKEQTTPSVGLDNENTSEFGDGCIYCLALFIAHQFMKMEKLEGGMDASLWFHGAGDHMFGFLPYHLPEPLRDRGNRLKEFILERRDCMAPSDLCKKEDVSYAIQEAKDILLEVDKLTGVPALKAQWS